MKNTKQIRGLILVAAACLSASAMADRLHVLGSSEEPSAEGPEEQPEPGQVWINDLTSGGTGCPGGSVSAKISDEASLVLLTDSFVTEIGPGVLPSATRKFCQISIDLHTPNGWQFALSTSSVTGYADLDAGVKANVQLQSYFSGQSSTPGVSELLHGPTSGDFAVVNQPAELNWSPCGSSRALQIKFSVALSNRDNAQARGLTSVTPEFFPIQDLVWRRCE